MAIFPTGPDTRSGAIMNIRNLISACLITSTCAASVQAQLSSPILMTARTLVQACTATPPVTSCQTYIEGYLEGLNAEGLLAFQAQPRDSASIEERALSTRTKREAQPRTRYCLPAPSPVRQITEDLIEYSTRRIALDQVTAANVLSELLQRRYSCRP
jgi:hypothetical protein